MACLHGDRSDAESRPNSLSEALLFATMCIIGLPVEVVVKDGSVYSGIFHTASVENDYGVVLKKARMIKNGKMKANTEKGCVIDTLAILSGDLVQVVAKGILLPAGGITGNLDGYITEFAGTIPTSRPQAILTKKCGKSTTNISDINQTRGNQSQGGDDEHGQKFEFHREASSDEVCESNRSSISEHTPVNPSEERRTIVESKELSIGLSKKSILALTRQDSQACESVNPVNIPLVPVSLAVSTSLNVAVNNAETFHDSASLSTALASPHSSESNKTTKEFKLNPDAKIFSPSFTNPISTPPPVPTVASITYIPNNSNAVPVAVAHAEIGSNCFLSRASVPSKVVPYGNLLAGNGGSGSQLSQPIVGHMGTRMQPPRYAGQYPVHSAPAYVSQNSQAAMGGRLGQLIYVHPVSHDLVQAPTTLSQICVRPLLTSPNTHFPKHQGSGGSQAVCMAPPFVGNGHPSVAVPNHIPLWQPAFPVNRPIQISGSNAFFTSKFS